MQSLRLGAPSRSGRRRLVEASRGSLSSTLVTLVVLNHPPVEEARSSTFDADSSHWHIEAQSQLLPWVLGRQLDVPRPNQLSGATPPRPEAAGTSPASSSAAPSREVPPAPIATRQAQLNEIPHIAASGPPDRGKPRPSVHVSTVTRAMRDTGFVPWSGGRESDAVESRVVLDGPIVRYVHSRYLRDSPNLMRCSRPGPSSILNYRSGVVHP